ncbi:hypothetical protein [Bacteroides oleiciplenus]|uniref:Uncharacterized protein n=1 Tax=Bacteroides oleiciplenus YIT 12058 TaxID=742727 RepID=K9E6Z3_9BACE|nr:hypothetical protein [Bacteroides oleiciplenus]EKU91641.1 hypothetical protein HMPREF9447_01052 [Bacteroides oleiciplenus YIT 12058]
MELKRITDSKCPGVDTLVALHSEEFSEYEPFQGSRLMYNLIDGVHNMYFHP